MERKENSGLPLEMDEKVQKYETKEPQTNAEGMDYEDVLKKIGVGRTQWIVLFTCGLTLLMGMSETIGIGTIAIASKCDFSLSPANQGFLTGAGLIGNICSSYFWGYISDTIGRRPVLITTISATNAFALISVFIPNFWVFVFIRFCEGFSVSGSINITYVYLGEFFKAYYRPVVINYASLFVAFAVIFVPAVAWIVLLMNWSLEISTDFHFRPWRLLPILYVLPGMVSVLSLFYLPESPKILFSLGKHEEAYASLDWICKKNFQGRTYDEVVGFKVKPANTATSEGRKLITGKKINCFKLFSKMWNDVCPLFQRPLVRNFAICCVITSSIYSSYLGISLWYPEIQNSLRLYTNDENKMKTCDVMELSLSQKQNNATFQECNDKIQEQTYIDCFIYGGICIGGYAILGILIKLLGRKVILIGFLAVAGIMGLSLLWILEPFGIVLSFSLFLVLTQLCMSTMSGIIVDLIPTNLCGQAICLCLMIGRLGSVIATNLVGAMMETHCALTFSLVSGFSIICAFLGLLLPI